ncbi:PREDICTED: probable sugar phosphate/phosphate translocator At1g06470 [Camelina sativa]|uniref:Probable sugar phosphate/phosphate translocator At1g06470 n=1 Tax=Camelina sativa TaxID=90675 RepID=A0ABM0WS46_CAMSA|nr:PREDICTED: probable sugar phosphate/phosphate translocator At1g06470 [Camelina sativa]
MEQRVQLRSGTMEPISSQGDVDREQVLEPFDIENVSGKEIKASRSFDVGYSSSDNLEPLPKVSTESISPADVLKTLFFILVWYTFSTFLTLYNKTLLGDDLGKFPAPLLMNTIHFSIQAVLSKMITWYWSGRFHPDVTISWRDYFVRVVPTALGTAMDINLSNESLVFISVTFATMCKSAAPIYLLLFAFAFRLESPSLKLFGIISVISAGILLTVAKETEFEFWGFVFVMLAAVMSGFRWCMTQVLLQKESFGLKNPFILMSYMAPVMAIVTGLLSLLLDPWSEFGDNKYFDSGEHFARTCFLMLFGGALAFCMVLTEYVLVSVTSAVTVTIAGVVKEAVTIVVAVFYFHDDFTWLKGVGLVIIMVGVSLFNWYKYDKLQKGHKTEGEKQLQAPSQTGKYVILDEMDDQDNSP